MEQTHIDNLKIRQMAWCVIYELPQMTHKNHNVRFKMP